MGEGKEILKFDGGEEIKPCTGCTYLGTKIDQSGDNTTEMKYRTSQTRKTINILNSVWWHKNISKSRKLYRVSIKSSPDYKHFLQENCVEYKNIFYHYLS